MTHILVHYNGCLCIRYALILFKFWNALFRDCGIYSISGFRHGVPNMMEAIADSVLYPDFSPENVNMIAQVFHYAIQ